VGACGGRFALAAADGAPTATAAITATISNVRLESMIVLLIVGAGAAVAPL
jgi:hypothetical protein